MANVQIPNLPAAISLNGTEQLEAVQAGTTCRITTAQIATLVTGSSTPFPVNIGGTGADTFTAGYLKADGTNPFTTVATIPNTDITGLGTMSTQNSNAVSITGGSVTGVTLSSAAAVLTGGSINGMSVGATTQSTGDFTNLSASGTITITGTISPSVVISGSSASAALRVTQTGAGDAILVEDSANPDSTPFVVTATGDVGIGVTAPVAPLQILGTTQNRMWLSGAAINSRQLFVRSNGTFAAPTIVSSGDEIGSVNFFGYDGAANIELASMVATVDGTPGLNDMPGRLTFFTTADGASAPTERFRIGSAGQLGIAGANYGTATQYMKSGGASAAPSWATIANTDISGLGTMSTQNANSVSITGGSITGITDLAVADGGTGVSTFTTDGVLYGAGAGAILATAQGGANTILTANAGAPSFSAAPTIGTSVTVPAMFGGTAVGSVLAITSTSGVGTTDAILFDTGSQVERVRMDSTGQIAYWQPAQVSKAAAATLTNVELRSRIIQYTGAAATLTLPTGTNLEGVFTSTMATDTAFEVTFINTSANLLTIGANGNTTVGTLTVATLTSGTFRFRKTAANTFTVYRVA